MVYLDGRDNIREITGHGSSTMGYKGWHDAVLTQDYNYNLQPKGNYKYINSSNREKLKHSYNISRNTQVTEKIQDLVSVGRESPKAVFLFSDYFVVTVKSSDIPGYPLRQPSLISEQVKNNLFPATGQPGTPSKESIDTHGKMNVISPNPFTYGGTVVITNPYIKGGRDNAFTTNPDGTLTAKDPHAHPAVDLGLGGATVASMKKRGILK